eukprot:Anaeramoba_ignava/a484128_3.p1 GENE.a484128_3~~a484128_3.p1  ORF type:complete len:118 (-),score=34.96 a484128_3:8-361(-)
MNLKEQLTNLLNSSVILLTTSCAYHELRNLGDKFSGASLNAKRMQQTYCGHQKPKQVSDCFLDLIGKNNKKHFFVASQDIVLRQKLRKLGCVPLLYIQKGQIFLEKIPKFVSQKKDK